jgi:hypothetical protein
MLQIALASDWKLIAVIVVVVILVFVYILIRT